MATNPSVLSFKRTPTQTSRPEAAHALRFVELLGQQAAQEGAVIVDLEGAVGILYDPRLYLKRGTTIQEDTVVLRRLCSEVERHTRGCDFRVDTPAGPVFLDRPLWEFAGRSGCELGEPDTWTERPTWQAVRA